MKNTQSDIGKPDKVSKDWKIGIVHSSFYKEDVLKMVESARKYLVESGINPDNISVYAVAGCFEIPLIGSALADKDQTNALMGLGIVVQGKTQHAQEIAKQSARGMMNIQVQYKIPFAYEVLHVDALEDAQQRIESKGKEAAIAVLSSLKKLNSIVIP
ncbi:MAG: 6,7-dimethyl-8-ribityllumazine synthase [Candidatus Peribacteraceae bacterium]|jgi:6,7-dimethyl-8-ribityllumazine synthase|nr:6,7-dimethyl-8-ribityllumazine synthase [Candidatus Peribacteraceae bacterium]MDP7454370.1 6,7-dimethyl-8-ribityllumazine synthase [Candidatus Peribacteraceae bacterium]MDP7646214.1 6,7-dimethyl-8-ribityllumazine synthase [Candidatus Peribacteraceae bacterium]